MSRCLAFFVVALVTVGSACGGGASTTPDPAPSGGGTPGAKPAPPSVGEASRSETPPEEGDALRDLGKDATFADLVAHADRIEAAQTHRDSDAGCLLRERDGSFRLEADLAGGIRPLPSPSSDLAGRLAAARTMVSVLSVWGRAGEANELAVVTFTTHGPSSNGFPVLFLTEEGVVLRTTDRDTPAEHAGPFPVERTTEHLSAVLADSTAPVVVTADGATPLPRLYALLSVLSEHAGGSALAVPLEQGTKLPARADDSPPGTDGVDCLNGALPPPRRGSTPGDADETALRAGFATLADAARTCANTTPVIGSDEARFTLKLRIGAEGTPLEVCAVEHAGSSPPLRACVVDAARQLRFGADTVKGYIEVELPLSLSISTAQLRQAPICS